MGRIRSLPQHVVDQIAAGEVVERPASVVKELVENALDAGARRIDVRLVDGGRSRIEVADDGHGMDPDDVGAAFLPHATSKLSTTSDLEHIASLGFRGEALASIASVSRATLVSRPAGATDGARVEAVEGRLGPVRPAAAAPGTVVTVEGLFQNVPARRKFLRSASTEAGHAADVLVRLSLAHPETVFTLECDGRATVRTESGEGRASRIARFHGGDLGRALLRAGGDLPAVSVEAWIAPPGLARGDGRLQQAFVNGRFVRDRTLSHAIREAYRDLLPPGDRHPVAFVFVACDPAAVDVNVHPTKAEVRWRDSSAVHEAVRTTLRAALVAAPEGVPVAISGARGAPLTTVAAAEFAFRSGAGAAAQGVAVADPPSRYGGGGDPWGGGEADLPGASAPRAPEACAHDGAHAAHREYLRPLGQALGTYLLFEGEDGIVLVDQHALHERVLFDRISSRLNAEGRLEVQRLLVPAVVRLSAADVARVEEDRALLLDLGWDVEPFGDAEVAVHACPSVLARRDPAPAFLEAVSLVAEGRRGGVDRATLLSCVVDRLACRAAVMAGDALHPDEVLALLEQAEALNHSHTCPHGRPTRLVLARASLERHFHRRV
jgi:DNA mismatch repair protein MutL